MNSRSGQRAPGDKALRVLLVEDSLDDADLVVDELRDVGYTVDCRRVESGAGLRAALNEGGFQLVLCDYALPGFDALDALAILQAHGQDIPFIVVSGATADETAVELMQAGAHDFLVKGKLARLGPVIERELREAEIRRERSAIQQKLLLSDRLVQIGTLAAGVAHEINNPLAYVIGNIEYAIDALAQLKAADSEPVIAALKQAQEGAQRIRTTCDDLRVFSRSEDGEPQPVQLRRVLESAIAMAWTQIRHRARLTRDFHDLPPMAASENRLAQVFLNLLINAAQAIPEGDAAGNEIHVALRHAGAHAEIEVSDTGSGISAGAAEKLFQPFFTTKPQGVGTGLGLSICHKIVTDYQGEISARPNGSRGTTFCVRLPLVTVPPRPATRTPTSKPSARRGRVLVIDDEPAIVDLIIRVLRAEHDVVGSAGAGPALALLREGREFDVIFCDLMMPDVSGVEFYHELARSAPHLAERVIFLSGGAFTASARQLLQSVPNLSLQKPFDSSALRALVRERLVRDSRPPIAATRANP